MIKQNLHTHTLLCDGNDTLAELVSEALKKNFDSIGFSGHGFTFFDESYCMSLESEKKYFSEISRLKLKFKDKIEIFCGIEQDYYSDKIYACDYIIGSVHYILKNGIYIPVDENPSELLHAADTLYGGDIYSLIEDYYKTESDVVNHTNCDIIGHFNLITKFSEQNPNLFDVNHERFVEAEDSALRELLKTGKIFELNTGATAKGYKSEPYPGERNLRKIARAGGKITITSDCHTKETLDFYFSEAPILAKKCGFNEIYVLKDGKFIPQKI